jgi:16S rRNA G966 N2-methylase RsmD
MASYSQIAPIVAAIPAERQAAARHYGVHPYFTRRPANVVRAYVEHYSRVGDTVLDPFGGTGVTAIESLLAGRRAIHNDLNPFANFITANIADTSLTSTVPLKQAFARIETACAGRVAEIEQADETRVREWLRPLPLPANIRLPRNSDAENFHDLFTPRQLAGLATLKQAIDAATDQHVRGPLLLAWSATVAKLNKTFLSAEGRAESRGGSSIFSIYRYKLANRVIELPIWETFRGRFINVLAAKEEVLQLCDHFNLTHPARCHVNSDTHLQILAQDAAALALGPRSVDYVFTDPPYGAHIAYLDLSILWNHWLGFPVTAATRAAEAIVGGECGLSEDHYKQKLADSLRECFRVLKPDRWCSVVFQHWDASYFATILETARECGGTLKAAVTQERDVIWSMHKKKNSANVLSGEMILTFHKSATRSHAVARKTAGSVSFEQILDIVLERRSGASGAFTSEFLFNQVILEAWRRDCLSALLVKREGFAAHLRSRAWNYDPKANLWSQSVNTPTADLLLALHETPAAYHANSPLAKRKPTRHSIRRTNAKTTN